MAQRLQSPGFLQECPGDRRQRAMKGDFADNSWFDIEMRHSIAQTKKEKEFDSLAESLLFDHLVEQQRFTN